jgi:hypothetical protein
MTWWAGHGYPITRLDYRKGRHHRARLLRPDVQLVGAGCLALSWTNMQIQSIVRIPCCGIRLAVSFGCLQSRRSVQQQHGSFYRPSQKCSNAVQRSTARRAALIMSLTTPQWNSPNGAPSSRVCGRLAASPDYMLSEHETRTKFARAFFISPKIRE